MLEKGKRKRNEERRKKGGKWWWWRNTKKEAKFTEDSCHLSDDDSYPGRRTDHTRFRSLSTMALAEERAAEERMIQGREMGFVRDSQMARERKRNNLKWSPHVMYTRPSILHPSTCTRVTTHPRANERTTTTTTTTTSPFLSLFSGFAAKHRFALNRRYVCNREPRAT